MKKIIKIEGVWYHLFDFDGGVVYAGKIYDLDNEVEKSGVIWYFDSFYEQHEFWYGVILLKWYKFIRTIKGIVSSKFIFKNYLYNSIKKQ